MDRRVTPRLVAVSLSAALALAAFPVMAGNDSWSVAGQPPGGNVLNVVVDPVTPSTLYATSGPGVYQSKDSGAHWNLVLPLPSNNASVVALEPEKHTTVYVATQGDGIFTSTDGGVTWSSINQGIATIGPHETDSVYQFAVDPVNDGVAYATTLNTGIYKTVDGGAHWQAIDTGIAALENNFNVLVNRVRVDPVNPQVLYLAVTEDLSPTNSSTALAGLYTSADGGAHWALTSVAGQDVGDVDIDPSDHTHLLALSGNGVLSITNSGASSAPLSSLSFSASVLHFDPSNSNHVLIGTYWNGLYQSTDGGVTWVQATGTQGIGLNDITVDPVTPANIYASTGNWGVLKSTDSGATWNPSTIGIHNVVVDLMVEGNDGIVYLASAGSGIYKSPDQGVTWNQVGSSAGGLTGSLPAQADTVQALVEDPTANSTLYAGGPGGVYKSLDGGDTWALSDTGLPNSGYTFGLAIDPEAPATLYAATYSYGAGVYKSVDGGATWAVAGTGLNDATGFQALAIDPHHSNAVYAGGMSNGLFKSMDGGATWQQDAALGVTPIWSVAVDPNVSNIVYTDTGKGFFKSTDGGATWVESDNGLNGYLMTSIRIDPANTSIILVSPLQGIGDSYLSPNGGANWFAMSTLSPTAQSAAFKPTSRKTSGITRSIGVPSKPVLRNSATLTIGAVAMDPNHPTQLLGGASDGQVYSYDLNNLPKVIPQSSGNGGATGGSTGGSKASGGGGDFSLLLIAGLAGFAARRKH